MKNIFKRFIASNLYENSMLCLVTLSIFTMIMQSISGLNSHFITFLDISDIVITYIFITDYIFKIIIADKKTNYILSFYGLIDLLSIVPSLIPGAVLDLRTLRLVRTFRILRLFKIKTHSDSVVALINVFKREKDILIATFFGAFMIIICSGIIVYGVESPAQPDVFENIPQAIWWAIATMTTVGYGDIYPITLLGKIIATILIFVGIGIIAIPSSVISAGFLHELQQRSKSIE